ncbi:hypothetical protein AGABI1DRAFT_134639 [Agaricus bisporus var. burnettii JB137-S8]|uniref:Uncharacterized protein n=1 Tax=Agaricus bisporus var. burnettii (strain JB137-S8 / ATCC MYA-4627 / FGSC 10392) TaxID=597362 RepID=K5WE22_AGABU|nr:uncharacterized protein AGABI1DRAFT_134639 [Agaricus bisporus var. burnettii JB137-S8]EKM73506.1 hypothetical protein AGABI1DRAFT_134639 [Agaricus bisporus var. burnettii JB137-S8]
MLLEFAALVSMLSAGGTCPLAFGFPLGNKICSGFSFTDLARVKMAVACDSSE